MVADEPRVRRRGMFFHVETPELDQVEHEAAKAFQSGSGWHARKSSDGKSLP